ncbi:MAG: translocation/assembly module TamB domain-containing protein [Desulfobacteraceae bacterium]|nr:translocation/assembly module TamB domain-containing protein [Desulfobacteraceae bacterium]
MRTKVKKIIMAVGALLLLGVIAALWAASFYLNSASFRGQLLALVNEQIKGRIQIESHHLSVFSSHLTLAGIALADPNGQSVALIQNVNIGIFWPALLGHSVHITSLSIGPAEIALRQDSQDRLNLLQAFEPVTPTVSTPTETQASAWQVRLDDLRLHQVKFSYDWPAQGLAVSAQQIEADGGGDLLRRFGHLRLTIGGLAVKAGEIDEHLDQITLAAEYDEHAKQPISLEVKALDSSIALKGRVTQFEPELELDAACGLNVALDQLNPWLPQIKDLTGRLKGQVQVQGPWDDPQASLRLTLHDGGAAGFLFKTINLDAALAQRQILLKDLQIQSAYADLNLTGRSDWRPVFPKSLSQIQGDWNQATYELDMTIHDLKPAQIPLLELSLQGSWQGQIHVQGVGVDPDRAKAKLAAALAVQGFKLTGAPKSADGRLALEAQWHPQRLSVQKLQTTLGATDVQAQGWADWKKKEIAVQGGALSKQLSELGDCLDLALPDGRVDLKFDGQGPWQQPVGKLSVAGENLAMAGWQFGRLTAEASLDRQGILSLPRLAVENSGGRLAGQGRLTIYGADGQVQSDPQMSAALEASRLRLSDFNKKSPVDLELNGRLALAGTLLAPIATLTLSGSRAQWHKVACEVAGKARWDDGLLEISKLQLSHGRSAVQLKASAQWREAQSRRWSDDPILTAELKAEAVLLQDFIAGAKGTLTTKAELQGKPSALKGAFGLKGTDLGTSTQSLASLALDGRLLDQTIHVDQLEILLSPGQQVEGSGWYTFDQRFQAELRATKVELARLEVLQQQNTIAGSLDLNLQASGSVDNPLAQAGLVIHSPAVNQHRFEDFHAAFRLQDHLLTAQGDLNFKFSLSSQVERGDFDLAVAFDHSDLSSFLALALKGPWAGQLSGQIKASGNWHQPDAIQAEAALKDGRISYEEVNLISLEALNARLDKGFLDLPATKLQLMQAGYLEVTAKGHLDQDLALRVDGRLPMAVLAPFTDAIERPKGEIQIQAKANGPWHDLNWYATVAATDVGCLLTDLDQSVHDLNGRIQITADEVRIEKLAGQLDDGQFSLDGQIQLAQGRPQQGEIAFKATSLPIQWPDTMDLKLSTTLTLKGNLESATLDGRVVLLEGAYYKRFKYNLMSALAQPQRGQPVVSAKPRPDWMKAVALNVVVTNRYPFLVDNNVARLEIAPDLKLTGTIASPIVAGRAQINEGEVYFRGKTFTVQQGAVDFVNPYKIEPDLDISAQTKVRQYTIQLEVSGTPDNLKIKLTSTPSESDADILSLILFGRTSSEISEQKNGSDTTTGEMLASLMTSVWGEELKKSAGVDILEMETKTPTEEGADATTQLTVGKQLTRRLTVKYAIESGSDQTVQRAISEYRLLEHILASGFQDSSGKYGGELMFRVEFR